MAKTTHTAGPRVIDNSGKKIIPGDMRHPSPIATVHRAEDARLIASAPDLLHDAEYIAYAAEEVEDLDMLADDCPVKIVVTAQTLRDIKAHALKAAGIE